MARTKKTPTRKERQTSRISAGFGKSLSSIPPLHPSLISPQDQEEEPEHQQTQVDIPYSPADNEDSEVDVIDYDSNSDESDEDSDVFSLSSLSDSEMIKQLKDEVFHFRTSRDNYELMFNMCYKNLKIVAKKLEKQRQKRKSFKSLINYLRNRNRHLKQKLSLFL